MLSRYSRHNISTSNDYKQLTRNNMNMQRIIGHLHSWYFIVTIFLLPCCNSSNNLTKKDSYGEATKELIEMVDKDAALKSMLIASIEKAKQANPDTNTNPI